MQAASAGQIKTESGRRNHQAQEGSQHRGKDSEAPSLDAWIYRQIWLNEVNDALGRLRHFVPFLVMRLLLESELRALGQR
jgi:hypothetical protein